MLDVHVLMMDYTDPAYHRQCKESIEQAIANAGYPVNVHYLPGVYGHLGEARYRGYSLGKHPYVTHVDDDDYIAPNAFAVLKPFLEQGEAAVTTGENWVVNGEVVQVLKGARHHLAVYRRELMQRQPYRHFKFYPDQFLMRQIKGKHISECVYFLRVAQDSGSRRCRDAHPEEVKRELELLKRPDLVAMESLSRQQIAELYDEWLEKEK